MEKRNQIVPGTSPCNTGGRPTTHIVAKKALARGEDGMVPDTLKSFTVPLEPVEPLAHVRRVKCH